MKRIFYYLILALMISCTNNKTDVFIGIANDTENKAFVDDVKIISKDKTTIYLDTSKWIKLQPGEYTIEWKVLSDSNERIIHIPLFVFNSTIQFNIVGGKWFQEIDTTNNVPNPNFKSYWVFYTLTL